MESLLDGMNKMLRAAMDEILQDMGATDKLVLGAMFDACVPEGEGTMNLQALERMAGGKLDMRTFRIIADFVNEAHRRHGKEAPIATFMLGMALQNKIRDARDADETIHAEAVPMKPVCPECGSTDCPGALGVAFASGVTILEL